MSEAERVQRWRQRQREEGKEHMSLWLSKATKLRLEDLAATWRSSPSELVEQALAQFHPSSQPGSSTVADTEQLQELIQQVLVENQAVTAIVTDTVTATLARDLPGLVRQLMEGLALEALGLSVTDTDSDVTDTDDDNTETEALDSPVIDTDYGNVTEIEISEQVEEAPARRKGGRPWSAMGQRIIALLGAHPEGLSAEEIRAYLKPERPLGDALQSLRKRARVRIEGQGRAMRYFVA